MPEKGVLGTIRNALANFIAAGYNHSRLARGRFGLTSRANEDLGALSLNLVLILIGRDALTARLRNCIAQFVKSRPALVGSINQEEEEMNLKTITAAILLLSTPTFAAGICIVCPPGYDCSTGTPVLDGATGQVLTRTENGTEWNNFVEVGAVPTTRTIAGFDLSGDITVGQLRDVLDVCNLPIPGTPGGGTVEYRCSTTNGTQNIAGNPSSNSGQHCWCRFMKNDFTKVLTGTACGVTKYSSWVFSHDYTGAPLDCASRCSSDYCTGGTNWRSSAIW